MKKQKEKPIELEAQELEKETSPLLIEAKGFKIDSVESIENASVFLRKLKDTEDNIEEKRLEFTKPLNLSLKAINSTFKGLIKPLTEARNLLSEKILSWRKAENERLAKEEQRRQAIQESHKEKGHNISAPIIMERPEARIGNTQTRKVWKYKITDFSKLSDDFKIANEVLINQNIRQGIRHIDGLDIYQEETLSIVR